MTHHIEIVEPFDPFDPSEEESRSIIELPFWDEEMSSVFWPAVNAPTYRDNAEKTAALVRYVWGRAHLDGVRSILGRDS